MAGLNVVFAQVGYFISRTQQFNRTSLSWSLFELVLTTRKVKLPEEQTGLARVLQAVPLAGFCSGG